MQNVDKLCSFDGGTAQAEKIYIIFFTGEVFFYLTRPLVGDPAMTFIGKEEG